jgi:ABC-2 type transport system permease protein
MNTIMDKLALEYTFLWASYRSLLKSPLNIWLSTAMQFFYYVVQGLFWFGIASTEAGRKFITQKDLMCFLVTLAFVDNLYLFLLGGGSFKLMGLVSSNNLDPYLLWPRNPLLILTFSSPGVSFLPSLLISIVLLAVFYIHYHVPAIYILIHLASCIAGALILNGISFIHKMSVFWTNTVVNIKNSNPSFKIIVRPPQAFGYKLRFFLMFIFPALSIVGVPFEILSGSKSLMWFVFSLCATLMIWIYVFFMWKKGVTRYGKITA